MFTQDKNSSQRTTQQLKKEASKVNSQTISRQETAEFDSSSHPELQTPLNSRLPISQLPPKIPQLPLPDSQAPKRPIRQPWNNKEAVIETTNILKPENIKKVDLSIASTRTCSLENRRYARTPEKRPNLLIDIPKFSTDHKMHSTTGNTQTNLRKSENEIKVLVKNKEVEMKHQLAQSIIELINQNEKLLGESNSKLQGYLGRSLADNPTSCLGLVDSLKKQWMQRLKNLSKIFELIDSRREASIPQDLLESVYQTPRSLCRTINFTN